MNPLRAYIFHKLIALLPSTRLFGIKLFLLRWAGAKVGSNVRIVSSAQFLTSGPIAIGDNTWIGHESLVIGGQAPVTIGKDVDIGPRVTISTGTHKLFTTPGRAAGEGYSLPVHIDDGVWIGVGAIVLGGIHIGKSAMIAAGSLVNKDVPENTVVGGVPAKPIFHTTKAVADEI